MKKFRFPVTLDNMRSTLPSYVNVEAETDKEAIDLAIIHVKDKWRTLGGNAQLYVGEEIYTFELPGLPARKVIESVLTEYKREDGGQALLTTFPQQELDEDGMIIQISSWDQMKAHEEIKQFLNKKVRVTIEVVEE